MKRQYTCNWYHYIDFSGMHVIELEFIDHTNGNTFWKTYKAETRPAVCKKAQCFETRFFNRMNKSI